MVAGGKIPRSAGSCDFCGSQIPVPDFQEARAGVVSDRICCAGCMESGAWFGSAKKPRGAEAPICRGHARFVPSTHLDLALRLPGWRGLLYGNLAKQWLDVSGEGLRAVVGRHCAVGDLLMVRIVHRPTGQLHEIVSSVRNVQESRKFPGCVLAGFLFANPTTGFREMLRSIYGSAGIPEPARAPAQKAKKHG
jgi:hypothetical protein